MNLHGCHSEENLGSASSEARFGQLAPHAMTTKSTQSAVCETVSNVAEYARRFRMYQLTVYNITSWHS